MNKKDENINCHYRDKFYVLFFFFFISKVFNFCNIKSLIILLQQQRLTILTIQPAQKKKNPKNATIAKITYLKSKSRR